MALLHTGATCSAECYEPESDDAAPAALHAAASPATWQRPARQHGGCVAPFNLCMHEHISLIMLPEHLQSRMAEAWSSQSGLPAAAVRTASHAGSSVVSHMQSSAGACTSEQAGCLAAMLATSGHRHCHCAAGVQDALRQYQQQQQMAGQVVGTPAGPPPTSPQGVGDDAQVPPPAPSHPSMPPDPPSAIPYPSHSLG